MKSVLPLLLLLAALIPAQANDSDLDGVDDANDRCPGTPFELTVTADGCPEEAFPLTAMLGIGSTYTTGKYGGTTTTDALSVDLLAAVYAGNAYLSVAGSYYIFGANDPAVAQSEEGGVGDTFVGAGYLLRLTERLTLTPGIHAKLATADTGLGTGENDVGGSLLAVYRIARSDLFLQYGYTVTGDAPETEYRDVSFGSAGVTFYPGSRSSLSLSYDFSESYLAALPDLRTLSLMGSYALYDTLTLQAGYSLGLSDSASEHALSFMLLKRF